MRIGKSSPNNREGVKHLFPFLLFQPFKQIILLIIYRKLFQEINIFLPECSGAMMFFLAIDIIVHTIYLRMGIREHTITLLPAKLPFYKFLCINEVGRIVLYVPYQV